MIETFQSDTVFSKINAIDNSMWVLIWFLQQCLKLWFSFLANSVIKT